MDQRGEPHIPAGECAALSIEQIEQQAIDRAYRLGQTHEVRVFQMIAANTSACGLWTLQETADQAAQSSSACSTYRSARRSSSPACAAVPIARTAIISCPAQAFAGTRGAVSKRETIETRLGDVLEAFGLARNAANANAAPIVGNAEPGPSR